MVCDKIESKSGPQISGNMHRASLATRAAAEGVRVYAVSIVVGIAIGTGQIASIALITVLTLIYTFEGGLTAVIWTDVVQLFVYIAGALVVFVSLLALIPGGWHEVLRAGSAAGKFRVFDLRVTLSQPYTLWAGVIGGIALTLSTHGTDQFRFYFDGFAPASQWEELSAVAAQKPNSSGVAR